MAHTPSITAADVSVVIPARDAADTILRALHSVLDPEALPAEVILVDDASTDGTASLAASVPGVRVIRLPTPQGAAAARNAGVEAARGRLVAFQDADDEWLPGKLRRQLALLQADPDLLFVACGARLFGLDGQDRGALYDGRIPQAGADAWRGLLARNTIATPCVLAWRQALLDAGGFDPALTVAEDQDLWIRLSQRGRLGYLDTFLVRVHVTRVSVSGVGTALGAQQQMRITIPMVRRHVAALRPRLTRGERRRILGERLCRVGRAAYSHHMYRPGFAMVMEATLLGYRPLENIVFVLVASPPARWLKRRIGWA